MPYSHILFQVEESGIALLTVNRPEKLNALSGAVIGELGDAFGRVAADAAIRAAILTGAGEKAFVAGADIGELAALAPYEARAFALRGQAVFRQPDTCGKPSVAAVNGFALGGGLELAMACTVRFASENARLGQPEVKLGIIPGYGGTQRLPRLVGRGRALELLLSGEAIVAAEAYRILNQPTPPPFKESVKCAEQNLYTRAKLLVGDRDPREHEFSVQLLAFDGQKWQRGRRRRDDCPLQLAPAKRDQGRACRRWRVKPRRLH